MENPLNPVKTRASALGHKQSFNSLAGEWLLSDVKRTFKRLENRKSDRLRSAKNGHSYRDPKP